MRLVATLEICDVSHTHQACNRDNQNMVEVAKMLLQCNQSSFIHYSMGCCDLKDVLEADEMWAGYNFILFYMSTIPYLIVMGTGWALLKSPHLNSSSNHYYPYCFCHSIHLFRMCIPQIVFF